MQSSGESTAGSPRSQSSQFFIDPDAPGSPQISRGQSKRRGSGDDDSLQSTIGIGGKAENLNFIEFKKVSLFSNSRIVFKALLNCRTGFVEVGFGVFSNLKIFAPVTEASKTFPMYGE